MVPKILLIGCGKFGKHYLRLLKELDTDRKISLKGVITLTKKSREKIAGEDHVDTFSFEDMPLDTVDAVIIATPPSTHFEIAEKCIKKAHLLVEKPLALRSEEMLRLKELSEEYNKKIMVGHIYRFNNALKNIKKIIQKEMPRNIYIKFYGGIPSKEISIIYDYIHGFDILDYLLEEMPTKIICNKVRYSGKFESSVDLCLYYKKTEVSVLLSWEMEKERSIEFEIMQGFLKCDLVKQTITIDSNEECYFDTEPLKLQLLRFIDIIKGKDSDYPGIETALRIDKIIKRVYMSIRK